MSRQITSWKEIILQKFNIHISILQIKSLFKINFKGSSMAVSSISALPRHAVSADSWHASCMLCLQKKAKTKQKKRTYFKTYMFKDNKKILVTWAAFSLVLNLKPAQRNFSFTCTHSLNMRNTASIIALCPEGERSRWVTCSYWSLG